MGVEVPCARDGVSNCDNAACAFPLMAGERRTSESGGFQTEYSGYFCRGSNVPFDDPSSDWLKGTWSEHKASISSR